MSSKPRINLIAAMANNRTIGLNNQMPWHMPADLIHFKSITLSHPVLMGRKTYQSIGKALPGRRNIVISRDMSLKLSDADIYHSIEEAIDSCSDAEEIMIIGGSNIYQQMIDKADRLFLTFIDLDIDGDAYFPDWSKLGFIETHREQHQADEKNAHDYCFVTLKR